MIQALIEQSLNFIDALYSNVQTEQVDILTSIFSHNNSLLFIVQHLRIKRSDRLQEFYCKWQHYPQFNRQQFIMNILMLIQLKYNTKLCMQLLNYLFSLETSNAQYLSLLPKDILIQIKRYNISTYERREKELDESINGYLLVENISQCSRGYAEVTLAISTIMQRGVVKQSHHDLWQRIYVIVGRYNLNFQKVTKIMLTKSIYYLNANNQESVLEIVRHIPFQNFILFLNHQIYLHQELDSIAELYYVGSLQSLSGKTNTQLFQSGKYFYNPKYLAMIHLLLQRQIYSLDQFLQHFFYLTPSLVQQIQLQKMIVCQNKISEAFSNTLSLGKQQGDKRQQTILMGQALSCLKLALMTQYIRCNDFSKFQQLYQSIGVKIDFIVYMPVVRQLCLLLQWIIEPLYSHICYDRFFKASKKTTRDITKENGYFKQHSLLSEAFFIDLTQILQYLQLNIGFRVKTLVKVIRLFKIILHRNYFKVDWEYLIRFKKTIKSLTKLYLLPALTLQQQNCSLSFEMYSLLLQFTQEERFEMYFHYYNQIMFANPYLSKIFHNTIHNQFKILNKLNLKSEQTYHQQTISLSKFHHNQFLQSSFYLFKRGLSCVYENESQCYSKVVSKSTGLAGEGLAFLALNYLANRKQQLKDSKQTNSLFTRFIFLLFQNCKELDMSFFVQMALKLMSSAFESNEFEYFHLSLRMLKFIVDKTFPELIEDDSMRIRLQFLTYGYHLKLEMLDQIEQFNQGRQIRERLISIFISKIPTSDNVHHSLLYCFLKVVAARINLITKSSDSILFSAHLIDECMDFIRILCKFFAYQMDRERQKNPSRAINTSSFSDSEMTELIRGQQKIPMAFACLILRALRKHELFNIKIYQLPLLKRYWEKAHKQPISFSRFQTLEQVDQGRTNQFLHSDFYYFFWTSDIENICDLQPKYKEKIQQLRKIISQGDIFNVSANNLDKQNKQRYIQTYDMVDRQREDMRYYYDKFNITVQVISTKNTHQKVNKFTIPSLFVIKEDSDLRDFVSLLFLHCLLPRMSVGQNQAIFCSRLIYKVIKQNKLSSNKSLIIIFALIEAAISFIPFSTERQVRCISIFTSDFFRLFSGWHKGQEISVILQNQIGMERFTDKRYDKLKEYLMGFQEKIINILMGQNNDPYVIRNCMLFIERNENLPLSLNQSERIIKYLNGLQFQAKEQNKKTEFFIKSIGRIIESRSTKLVKFSKFNYQEQLKKYNMTNEKTNKAATVNTVKEKIYKQQQKKRPSGREHIIKY